MGREPRKRSGASAPRAGELQQLLAVEDRIDARLRSARARAEAILQRARSAAGRAEQRVAEDVEREVEEMRRGVDADVTRELNRITTAAARQAAALDQLPDDSVRALAVFVIDQVLP